MGLSISDAESVNQNPTAEVGDSPARGRSISKSKVEKAKEELQILGVQKEIADEIVNLVRTRLDEAEAEGKITKEEGLQLFNKYNVDVKQLETQLTRKEKIVQLYELEETQAKLMESFNKKLEKITQEIEHVRTSLAVEGEEDPHSTPYLSTPVVDEETIQDEKESSIDKAEQRLETIQDDIVKVLDKLKAKS